jgi:hypothetical protein
MADMIIANCCSRCDKRFEKGEEICVVAFAHINYEESLRPNRASVSDYTFLCSDCEDAISNTWPWED